MIFKKLIKRENKKPQNAQKMSESSKEKYSHILKRIQTSEYLRHDTTQSASYLIQLMVKFMNYREAEIALENKTTPNQNSILLDVYRSIFLAVFPDQTLRANEVRKEIGVNNIPILVNPWHGDRVLDAMFLINDENVFDGVKHDYNIVNTYVYPLNIIVCDGGNHSQFVAMIRNKGTTIITQELDIRCLYDHVEYDGDGFRRRETGEYLDLNKYNKDLLYYAGVLFELGRYLTDTNN